MPPWIPKLGAHSAYFRVNTAFECFVWFCSIYRLGRCDVKLSSSFEHEKKESQSVIYICIVRIWMTFRVDWHFPWQIIWAGRISRENDREQRWHESCAPRNCFITISIRKCLIAYRKRPEKNTFSECQIEYFDWSYPKICY